MGLRWLISALLTSLLSFGQVSWSDFDDPIIYTTEDGLHTNFIWDVYEDPRGFIWISSEDGVSVFDGSQFYNYLYHSIEGKRKRLGPINDIEFDNDGEYVFLATNEGVLTSHLDSINFDYAVKGTALNSQPVFAQDLMVDENNILWVGTLAHGLLEYNVTTGETNIISFNQFNENGTRTSVNRIAIDSDDSSLLWIGSAKQLFLYNKETTKIASFPYPTEFGPISICSSILSYQSKVFLGTFKNGWFYFDKDLKNFHKPISDDSEFFMEYVQKFSLQNQNELWLTGPQTLLQYDTEKNRSLKLLNREDGTSTNGLKLRDSRGVLWSADDRGLHRYQKRDYQRFIYIVSDPDKEPVKITTEIDKVGDDYYICPYYGTGIIKLTAPTFTVSEIPVPFFEPTVRDYHRFRNFEKMHNDNIAVLNDSKVAIIDTSTDTAVRPSIQIPDSTMIYRGDIEGDENGNYWIATHQKGLLRMNFDTGEKEFHTEIFKGKNSRNHQYLKELFVDSKNRLWIGQAATSVLNLQTMQLQCLNPELEYDNLKPFGNFFEDSKNRIWVANYLDGISYVEEDGDKISLRKVVDGSFTGIYEYDENRAWTVGSEGLGILNFDNLQHSIIPIETSMDIVGPVYNMGQGDFMIGCLSGVYIYNPDKHLASIEAPKLYLNSILANGHELYQGLNVDRTNLTFPEGTKTATLRLGALGFSNPNDIKYEYNFGGEWIKLSSIREINLANLSQGEYMLSVRPTTLFGTTFKETNFSLEVKPYWYTTDWAYLGYGLMMLVLVYGVYKHNLNRKLELAETTRVKELDELKSKMFANISHEFRTPLTIIQGLSETLAKRTNDEEQKKLLKGIDYSNQQLLQLVNQMLDLASLDAKKMDIQYKSGNVVAFVKRCVDLYKSYSDSRLQTLKFISSDSVIIMDFDDDKLQKILNNLLSNAIKFTPPGGQVSIELNRINNNLRLIVSDTGKGISDDHITNVFDRYFTTAKTHGTGIGLALTKELVNLLGGEIAVKSTPDEGTIFTVLLPIKNESTNQSIFHQLPFLETFALEESDQKTTNQNSKGTILIVEDNIEIRQYLQSIFSLDYTIITAANGQDGLSYAHGQNVDIIISDIMMPKMDGLEFCRKLKSNLATSHISIIILSARVKSTDRQEAYALGVDAYLTKPFSQDELKLIIKNLLKKQQRQQDELSKLMFLQQPQGVSDINKLDVDLIKNLQNIILESKAKLKANDIAKKLYISRSQLHRKVKSLTGKSLTQYANHLRVEKAKYLLVNSDFQIKEISHQTGFETSSYFIRIFKQETRTTPENFRLSNKS